jgi:hypothetical protein
MKNENDESLPTEFEELDFNKASKKLKGENKDFYEAHSSEIQKYVRLMYNSWRRQEALNEQLMHSPKGFHSEEGGGCVVCSTFVRGEKSWYDKNGMKCLYCQEALDKKIIPLTVLQDKESWYSRHDLERYFNLKGATLKRIIREGLIKSRIIKNEKGRAHLELFLLKDNEDVLPPKSLLRDRVIKVTLKDGEYFTSECWYENPKMDVIRELVRYKITTILHVSLREPFTMGQFYWKSVGSIFEVKEEYR